MLKTDHERARYIHGRSAGRGRATKSIFALAMVLLVALPPRHADAEILTAIAITASVLSALISLGDSGANPYGEMTAHNSQKLKHLHKRLNGYDRAFKAILQRLDALPKEIRKEIDDAFVDDRIVKVRSAVNLIVEDIKVFKKLRDKQKQIGGPKLTPIADASARLTHLQNTVTDLLQVEDDLIVFDIIAARYVEHATIVMQKGIEADTDWSIRKERYRHRFEKMLANQWRKNSLPWRYFVATNDGNAYLINWEKHEIDGAINNLYTWSTRRVTNCESEITYTITDTAKAVHTNMNDLDLLKTDRLKLIQSYDSLRSFYRYTIAVVQYELKALMTNPPPTLQYPTFTFSDDYESRFLELKRRINDAVGNIPMDQFLFRKLTGQHCY